MPAPICFDFETEAADNTTPHRPPKPVGLAIAWPGRSPRYYAFGHPTGNDSTEQWAKTILKRAYDSDIPLLCHNAAFDLAVAEHHWGLPWPDGDRVEDTTISLFLANPYIPLGLKEAGEQLLGISADEQRELFEWIKANVPEAKRKKKLGAFISKAPGELVGKYACQDVTLTRRLHRKLGSIRRLMPEAYRRECSILRVAWRMTQRGIPIDVSGLERFLEQAEGVEKRLATNVRRHLRAPGLDLGKRGEVANAMERAGLIHPDEWIRTGRAQQRSTNIHDVALVCENKRFVVAWEKYQLTRHMLQTFVRPWLAKHDGGRIHARWNTIVSYEEGRRRGAKTGRLSSEPNVQNISKEAPPGGLPSIREYVAAERGERIVCGDLSQQEPRVTAHFAGGAAIQAYLDDPDRDDHLATAELMGVERGTGKTLNLATTYALGLAALGGRLGRSQQEAAELRAQWRRARPEIAKLDLDLRRQWAKGGAIATWGGAVVYREGERFSYRALNCLIQRSAAEQLKEILLALEGAPLILTAHDEIALETDRHEAPGWRLELQEVMEQTGEFNVPMRAEVGVGVNWFKAKP